MERHGTAAEIEAVYEDNGLYHKSGHGQASKTERR